MIIFYFFSFSILVSMSTFGFSFIFENIFWKTYLKCVTYFMHLKFQIAVYRSCAPVAPTSIVLSDHTVRRKQQTRRRGSRDSLYVALFLGDWRGGIEPGSPISISADRPLFWTPHLCGAARSFLGCLTDTSPSAWCLDLPLWNTGSAHSLPHASSFTHLFFQLLRPKALDLTSTPLFLTSYI